AQAVAVRVPDHGGAVPREAHQREAARPGRAHAARVRPRGADRERRAGKPLPMIECDVMGERLLLLAERAAFWPARKALLVADFHLGKAASFRSAGIPLPSGTTTENVERLDRAVAATSATQVIFLGD